MSWPNLPLIILHKIYKLLSRRDLLACTMVCLEWREAMDYGGLWKRMVICLDTDFQEPSTTFLTRLFLKHLKILEIGWANPVVSQSKWSCLRYKDITKRVGRYLLILHESFVQLHHLKISDWYDVFQLRKLSYLLLRFLKYQSNLKKITLTNANLYKVDFANILVACLRSKTSVVDIEVHNSCFFYTYFDGWIFTSCLEQYACLERLCLDYWIFVEFVNKVEVRNGNLKRLEVYVDENDNKNKGITPIPGNRWKKLKWVSSKLRVAYTIRNIAEFNDMDVLLNRKMPLDSLTWHTGIVPNHHEEINYVKTFQLLADRFRKRLEFLDVQVFSSGEHLDVEVRRLKERCKKLRCLYYNEYNSITKTYI